MTEPSGNHNSLRQLYCTLMREIKLRTYTITGTLEGNNPFPAFAAFEFCYLQFRMICETIALACLAVHGDIPATRTSKFKTANEADWILKRLGELHPEFFPVPITMKQVGHKLFSVSAPPPGSYLKKTELLKLYGKSGAFLHRGTFSNIRRPLSTDFDKVKECAEKIVRLLAQHQIRLSDGQAFLVTLESTEHNGEVFAVLSHEVTRLKPGKSGHLAL